MNFRHKSTKRRTQAGAAMLIAIFALLLISVIAIALIVSSGTETALAKNYRTSTSAYYAGLAGLEEGRGRLLWRNANYLNNTVPLFMPASGNPSMNLSQVLYIENPAGGEVVDPTDLSGSNPYADNEYLAGIRDTSDVRYAVVHEFCFGCGRRAGTAIQMGADHSGNGEIAGS